MIFKSLMIHMISPFADMCSGELVQQLASTLKVGLESLLGILLHCNHNHAYSYFLFIARSILSTVKFLLLARRHFSLHKQRILFTPLIPQSST